jgi:nucleotide-binding universal stress UspA family protein
MEERTARTIVVGVDASEPARAALEWAVGEARDGDTIEVVHAWNLNAIAGFEAPALNPATFEVEANRLLHEAVSEAIGPDRDDLTVVYTPVHGHPAEALIERSADADLLVVGRRGQGGFKEMLLGSVSRDVVHHAACPVVVIPPTSR